MKFKFAFVPALFFCSSVAYCGSSDSLHLNKVMHHFQLLIGNYASESFITPNKGVWKPYYSPPGQINYGERIFSGPLYQKPSFTPLYTYAIGFTYKADLSQHLGIRTGLNYFTYGYIAKGTYEPCPECTTDVNLTENYRRIIFLSSLQLPLHLIAYKSCKHGRFVFSAGPEFYLPINTFGKESTVPVEWPIASSNYPIHYHVNALDFLRGGSMGFALGLGYEKTLSKKLAIEVLPDVRLLNLVPFDFEGQGKGIYQNYIFNATFGLSTYVTFTK